VVPAARGTTPGNGELAGLPVAEPSKIDRWFARAGTPPVADLARSGAPARSMSDILGLASHAERDAYFEMSLDYGPGEGSEELREAVVAAGFARRPGEVVVTNGAVEALLLACAATCPSGARRRGLIAVATPVYEGIVRSAGASGASILTVPVWREGEPELDLGGFGDGVLSSCSAVIVNSPHNPTGLSFDRGALNALARRCRQHGTTLIVDEVAISTLDRRAVSFGTEPDLAGGEVVTIGDVSKSLGLGGLRVGWLATGSAGLLERVRALRDLTSLGSAGPSQALATIALRRGSELSCAAVAACNRARLDRWALGCGGALAPAPADGLVAFPRLPLAMPTIDFANLARRAEVAVMPGALFGCEGYLRIGLGIAPAVFADALATLSGLLAAI
jgi:aspartate/methionine/tyrosine aminotransferase